MYFTWDPETNQVTQCSFEVWRRLQLRVVKQEFVSELFVVSTIFLGIEGKLFEVALFDRVGNKFLEQTHYATHADALRAHEALTTSLIQQG